MTAAITVTIIIIRRVRKGAERYQRKRRLERESNTV